MEHIFTIGTTDIWSKPSAFGLTLEEARRHLYVVGKTGVGKTTLLQSITAQLIARGFGVGLIDPHGDLSEAILDHIPPHRVAETVYFNPGDLDYPIGFNLLSRVDPDARHLVTAGIVSAFKSIWRESWGPRMEHILTNSIASLLECENVTLLSLPRMLTDARYRAHILRQVADPLLLRFWHDEFEQYDPRFQREAVAPILNKVGAFVSVVPLRNIIGQVKRRVDPRYMMDNGRILITNLSKGKIGEEGSNLLGSLLVSQFQTAALTRSDLPEERRRDFFLIIDEAHNYTTDAFASILAEARKYRLNLILAHQYHDQFSDEVRSAIFGNTGTLISFRVGSTDARIMAGEYGSDIVPEHLLSLATHEVLVKHVGRENILRGTTSLAEFRPCKRKSRVIANTRQRFAAPRAQVEGKLNAWLGG